MQTKKPRNCLYSEDDSFDSSSRSSNSPLNRTVKVHYKAKSTKVS